MHRIGHWVAEDLVNHSYHFTSLVSGRPPEPSNGTLGFRTPYCRPTDDLPLNKDSLVISTLLRSPIGNLTNYFLSNLPSFQYQLQAQQAHS